LNTEQTIKYNTGEPIMDIHKLIEKVWTQADVNKTPAQRMAAMRKFQKKPLDTTKTPAQNLQRKQRVQRFKQTTPGHKRFVKPNTQVGSPFRKMRNY